MIRKLSVLSILGALFLGCSSGGDNSSPDAEAVEVSAETSQADMAAAEALKKKGTVTEPAIDTSSFRAAPAWAMPDLDGGTLTNADLAGKVVIVDFWATWCGPCKAAIPHLIELYDEYKDQGVEIVGVSLDRQGARIVEPFVNQAKINYPIVIGNAQVVQDFGGFRGIPTAFVISQDGKIVRKHVGFRPKEAYEKDIRALLGLPGGQPGE